MLEYAQPEKKSEARHTGTGKHSDQGAAFAPVKLPAMIGTKFGNQQGSFHGAGYHTAHAPSVIQRVHSSFDDASYANAAGMTQLGPVANAVINFFSGNIGGVESLVLRGSLVGDAGVPDSNIEGSDLNSPDVVDNQAHHIVEVGNRAGQQILANAGIDCNSAANGVLLPVHETDDTGNATVHNGSHVREYGNCVNRALQKAVRGKFPGTPAYTQAVTGTLAGIRRLLLNNPVPINRRVDGTYDPNGEPTVTDYFRNAGLI